MRGVGLETWRGGLQEQVGMEKTLALGRKRLCACWQSTTKIVKL